MIDSKRLSIIILITLLISLVVYHTTGIIQKSYLDIERDNYHDFYTLITISRILISMLIVLMTIKSKIIAKIFFGANYIGGVYQGTSFKDKGSTIEHSESFEIKQSLLETTINGVSFEKDKTFNASWKGRLVEEDNRHYKFSIRINSKSNPHDGLLNLRIYNKEVNGFYNSLIVGRENFRRSFSANLKE